LEGALARDIKLLDYIDALRGYAILGVIGIHASQSAPDLEWPLRALADQGARGVQLFFVVSALTLALSWDERGDGVLPFYIRRVFRIGPMFWLAILFFALLDASGSALRYWPPLSVSWANVVASATLTHGFHPASIASVVPGGWSVADEMTFYVLLPLLMLTLRSWTTTAIVLAVSIVLAALTYALMVRGFLIQGPDRELVAKYAYVWFPNQFPAFLAGILVFHLLRSFAGSLSRGTLQLGLAAAIIAMLAIPFVALAIQSRITFVPYFLSISYTLVFALATFCIAQGAGRMLVNAPVRYIGKVSYSAYFWHFAVLGFIYPSFAPFDLGKIAPEWLHFVVVFALATVLTVFVSSITYWLVEVPMIRLGRQVAAKAAASQTAGSTAFRPAE
jgi:peptidoglycan/LPS O-acetylase OafA/YrhL